MPDTNGHERDYDPSDIVAAAIVGAVAGLIPGAVLGYFAHRITDSGAATALTVLAAMVLGAAVLALYARVEDITIRHPQR